MREVESNGIVFEFPDGTPNEIVARSIRNRFGLAAPVEQAEPEPTPDELEAAAKPALNYRPIRPIQTVVELRPQPAPVEQPPQEQIAIEDQPSPVAPMRQSYYDQIQRAIPRMPVENVAAAAFRPDVTGTAVRSAIPGAIEDVERVRTGQNISAPTNAEAVLNTLTTPAPPQTPTIGELGEDIAAAARSVPANLVATPAAAIQGGDPEAIFSDPGWMEEAIMDARRNAEEASKVPNAQGNYVDMLGIKINRQVVRTMPQQFMFSVVSMAGSLLGGLGGLAVGTLVGGPVGGRAGLTGGRMLGGGMLSYRMDTNDFMRNLRDAMDKAAQEQMGRALTDKEFIDIAQAPEMQAAAKEIGIAIRDSGSAQDIALRHGLWEAGSEAVGNLIMLGAGKYILEHALKKSIIKPALGIAGGTAGEVATEVPTQMGQQRAESQAGITREAPRSFTSAADWWKSFEEVAGPTLLTVAGMGGLGGGIIGATRLAQRVDERIRPGAAVGRALAGDIDERAFSPEGARRAAVAALSGSEGVSSLQTTKTAGQPPPAKAAPEPPEPVKTPEPGSRAELDAIVAGTQQPGQSQAERDAAAAKVKEAQDAAAREQAGIAKLPYPSIAVTPSGERIPGKVTAVRAGENGPMIDFLTEDGTRLEIDAETGTQLVVLPKGKGTPEDPFIVTDSVGADFAASQTDVDASPGQKLADNYKKARIRFADGPLEGIGQIAIETPKGATRTAADGSWSVPNMPAHYGHLMAAEGSDGDKADVFIGDNPLVKEVYVIDQIDPKTGAFDETKSMLGFSSKAEAFAAYTGSFSDSDDLAVARIGEITAMPVEQWIALAKSDKLKKAVTYAETVYPDARQVRPRSPGGQSGLQPGAVQGGGYLQREPQEPADVGSAPGGRPAQEEEQPAAEGPRKEKIGYLVAPDGTRRPANRINKQILQRLTAGPGPNAGVAQDELNRRDEIANRPPSPAQVAAAKRRKVVDVDRDSILVAVAKMGGITNRERSDLTGERNGQQFIPGLGNLFREDGNTLDNLAVDLSSPDLSYILQDDIDSAGDNGAINLLSERIRDELMGLRKHWSVHSKKYEEELAEEARIRAEIEDENRRAVEEEPGDLQGPLPEEDEELPDVPFSKEQRGSETAPGGRALTGHGAAGRLQEALRKIAHPEAIVRAVASPGTDDASLAEEIARHHNKEVVWVEFGEAYRLNGAVLREPGWDKFIFVSVDTKHPYIQIVGHELTHFLRSERPDLYKDLHALVAPVLINHAEFRRIYGIRLGAPVDKVTEEMIGDAVGSNFTDPQFWSRVAAIDPTKFQGLAKEILRFIQRVVNSVLGRRSLRAERFVSDMKLAREAIAKAIAEYATKQDEQPLLNQPTPEALQRREEQAKAAEKEKAAEERKAEKARAGKKVTADQADLFNTQGTLFSRRQKNTYEQILAKQRATEGSIAAVRDPETGEVYTGATHEEAILSAPSDVMGNGVRERLRRDVYNEKTEDTSNVGFLENDKFVSKDRIALLERNGEKLDAMREAAFSRSQDQTPESLDAIKRRMAEREAAARKDPALRKSLFYPGQTKKEAADVSIALAKGVNPLTIKAALMRSAFVDLGAPLLAAEMPLSERIARIQAQTEDTLIEKMNAAEDAKQDQTQTPEFKRWFGKSVVTADGKTGGRPLVVYHGSDAERHIFDGGIFVTNDESAASAYAELKALQIEVDKNDALGEIVSDILAEEGGESITDLGPKALRDIADANGIDLSPDSNGHVSSLYAVANNPLDLREFGTDVGDVEGLWTTLKDKGMLATEDAWVNLDEDAKYELEDKYKDKAIYRFFEDEGILSEAFKQGYDAIVFEDVAPDGGRTHDSWLLRNNTQVKSATGNTGAFDPTNPDILFSPEQQDAALEAVTEALPEPSGKYEPTVDLSILTRFGVHPRTIAAFDSDFTLVKRTQSMQYQLRDEIVAEIAETYRRYQDLNAADRRPVDALLELGRLAGEVYGKGKDVATAKNTEFPQAQLSKVGETITLTDRQKSAYWSVRRAMDKALDRFIAELVLEAGLDPKTVKTAKQVLAAIKAGMPKVESDQLKWLADKVEEIHQSKRRGYVPFTRFGNVGIAVSKDDRTAHFEALEEPRIDFKRWRKTRRVQKRLDALRKEFPASQGYEVSKPFDLVTGAEAPQIDMPAFDQLMRMAFVDEAVRNDIEERMRIALKKRGFRKHFLGAQNIAGYSVDFERALADYTVSLAGYLARRRFAPQWDAAIQAIPSGKPKLRQYAQRYRSYINSPTEEFQYLRQVAYVYYLAAVPSTAMVNLSQVPMITVPYLMQFASPGRVGLEMTRAYTSATAMINPLVLKNAGAMRLAGSAALGAALGGWAAGPAGAVAGGIIGATAVKSDEVFDISRAPKDMQRDMKLSSDEGFFVPLATMEMMGTAYHRQVQLRKLSKASRETIDALASMFTLAERHNRIVTYIAAYRIAKLSGMREKILEILQDNALAASELGQASKEDFARVFAEWVVYETHYEMGKGNRPEAGRHVMAPIVQFKGFSWQTIELYARLGVGLHGNRGRVALLAMWTLLLITGGLWAFPFAENIRKVIEMLSKTTRDIDTDLKLEFRQFVTEITGSPRAAEIASYGAARSFKHAPEISGRIGMGDILPSPMDPASMLGIPFDLWIKRGLGAGGVLEQSQRGEPKLAIAAASPNFIKNWLEASALRESGLRSKKYGNKIIHESQINDWDVLMRGLGARTRKIAEITESEYAKSRLSYGLNEMKRTYRYRLAVAHARKIRAEERRDAKAATEYQRRIDATQAQIDAWNEGRPDHERITITNKSLNAAITAELIGPKSREKRVPKQMRAQRAKIGELYNSDR